MFSAFRLFCEFLSVEMTCTHRVSVGRCTYRPWMSFFEVLIVLLCVVCCGSEICSSGFFREDIGINEAIENV